MALCRLAAWKSQSSRVLSGAPRPPPCSLSPPAPYFTVSLLGTHRGSPTLHPDPALAQADWDKTAKVVAAIPLLALG